MSLNPKIAQFLEETRIFPTLDQLSPQQAREMVDGFRQAAAKFVPEGVRISDRTIPHSPLSTLNYQLSTVPHSPLSTLNSQLSTIPPTAINSQLSTLNYKLPLRIYTPKSQKKSLPILMFFHGGGWVLGILESFDRLCSFLAQEAECLVISVDYRRAPDFKYPTAAEDAYMATLWASQNGAELGGDPDRIAVAGDSAGGNLAAVVTLMARDRGLPNLMYQLLIYPVTNYGFDTPSYREFSDGYGLTREEMKWCWHHYLSHSEEGQNAYASPLQAETLKNLPPARVLISEYDVLRSETEAYCDRLEADGVKVMHQFCPGLIHGFLGNPNLWEISEVALREIAVDLRQIFAGV